MTSPSDMSFAKRARGIGILLLALVLLLMVYLVLKPSRQETADLPQILDSFEPIFPESDSSNEILAECAEFTADLRERYSDLPEPLCISAKMQALIGSESDAETMLLEACRKDPNYPDALYELGKLAMSAERFDDAAGYYEDLMVLEPEDPRVPVSLGEALIKAGHIDEATLVLEQHITTEAASVGAWLQLGQANLQLGKFKRAVPCFERVLESEPNSKEATYGLVRAYSGDGQKEKAKELNQRFSALAKQDKDENAAAANAFSDRAYAVGVLTQVLGDTAEFELQHGRKEEAIRLLVETCRWNPESVNAFRRLLDVLRDMGKDLEAVEVSKTLVELQPNGSNLIELGGLYASVGLHEDAIASFKRALELTQDQEMARRIEQILSTYEA